MITRRFFGGLAGLTAFGSRSWAQGWPSRPIVFTIPFQAGGSADLLARLLAERMATRLGPNARVIVENRAGAGGIIGSDYVRRQPADGYALLLATPSTHGTVPALQPATTPYDPIADFTPIAILGRAPIALAVPKDAPYRNADALLQGLRAAPGRASWGSSGIGSVGHLAGELMALIAGGLSAVHIPYRGGAGLAEALAKAEIQYAWEPLGSLAAGAKDGLFRILAMGSTIRHPLFPEVPTMGEATLQGFEASTWNLMLAPKGLPAELIDRLSIAANYALAESDIIARLAAAGIDAVSDSTPSSTASFLAAEYAKFRDIVRKADLRITQ
ncbi:MAG: Bug family tripartite tricarboxylate transporter substrate binding protein [Alphaproteobacteria bacterium]